MATAVSCRGELSGSPRPLEIKEKKCSMCLEVLPASSFWVRRKWPSGKARSLYAYCKNCQRIRSRAWDTGRRRREGVPESTPRGPYKPRAELKPTPKPPDTAKRPGGPRVPVDGLKRILQREIADHGRAYTAELVGADDKRLRDILTKQKTVTLYLADEWLTNLGYTLWDAGYEDY